MLAVVSAGENRAILARFFWLTAGEFDGWFDVTAVASRIGQLMGGTARRRTTWSTPSTLYRTPILRVTKTLCLLVNCARARSE
jgi:hypothetical protein